MGYQMYAGNGLLDGITTGVGLRKAYDEMKRQRGLADGMRRVADGDETGWQQVAENSPETYMQQKQWDARQELAQKQFDAQQGEAAWKRQYENELLGLKRKELENKDNRTQNMRDFEYFNSLTPEQQKQYMQLHKSGETTINVSPFEKKRRETFATKMDENIAEAQGRLNTAQKGRALLSRMETGGLKGMVMNAAPDWALSSDAQEFRAVQNQLIPQQRQAGSGTMSDADREMYTKATISMTKDTKANDNILGIQEAVAKNDIAYNELKAAWIEQGGSTTEFDKMWRKYSNENKIFTDKGEINGNRADPYEWFIGGQIEQQSPTRDEALAELKRRGLL